VRKAPCTGLIISNTEDITINSRPVATRSSIREKPRASRGNFERVIEASASPPPRSGRRRMAVHPERLDRRRLATTAETLRLAREMSPDQSGLVQQTIAGCKPCLAAGLNPCQ